MIRNTFRIFIWNFANLWKVCLYKLIAIGVTALIGLASFLKINSFFKVSGFWTAVWDLFQINHLFSGNSVFIKLQALYNTFAAGVNEAFKFQPFNICFVIFCIFILLPLLVSLSEMAMGDCLFGSMSSQAKFHFTASFFANLGKSFVFELCKWLIISPVIFLIGFASFSFASYIPVNSVTEIIMPMVIILFLTLSISALVTLITCWMPGIIICSHNLTRSFVQGLKMSFSNFFKIFSRLFFLFLFAIINYLVWGFIGVIILSPVIAFITYIFQMVCFFNIHGMSYYIDSQTIITPKRKEEISNIKRVRNII